MSNGEAGGIVTWTKPWNVNENVFTLKKHDPYLGIPKATWALNKRKVSSSPEARENMNTQGLQKLGHVFNCLNVDPTFRHSCLKISASSFIV